MKSYASLARFLTIAVCCWLVVGCEQFQEPLRLMGATMGTTYHITLSPPPDFDLDGRALQSDVDQLLVELNEKLSTYLPNSELSLFNRSDVNFWMPTSTEMWEVTSFSSEVYDLSDGAFDPTVGPLVRLWGFGADGRAATTPSDVDIATLLTVQGMNQIEQDHVGKRLRRLVDVELDYSGIAKGYAVDRVAQLLELSGVSDYMVEIGGEIRVRGHSPRGDLWRLAIERPDGGLGNSFKALSFTDAAVATSGDYRNYYEVDGKRVSHTLNPQTGRPITHQGLSVTVIHPYAAAADAWATALNVLGPTEGYRLASELGLAAFFIIAGEDGLESRFTQAFTPYLD